jgi:hybrid cluster-associated redox disulfide protein
LRWRKDRYSIASYTWAMMKLDSKITVSELMVRHPAAISVFIRRKMSCIGCPAEAFHTMKEVARMNGILLKHLLKDLRDEIEIKQNENTFKKGE